MQGATANWQSLTAAVCFCFSFLSVFEDDGVKVVQSLEVGDFLLFRGAAWAVNVLRLLAKVVRLAHSSSKIVVREILTHIKLTPLQETSKPSRRSKDNEFKFKIGGKSHE